MDFGRVLEGPGVDFGEVWSPSVRLLDGSWALLGRSWALWAAPFRLLGRLLGALGRSGGLLGLILVPRNAPGLDFGGVRDVLGKVLESSRGMFWDAFFCASHFVT